VTDVSMPYTENGIW